jgi:hypothetical protein
MQKKPTSVETLCRQNWVAMCLAQSLASLLDVSAGLIARGLRWPDREWLEICGGEWLGHLAANWSLAQGILPHDLETSQWGGPGPVMGCCAIGLLLLLLLLLFHSLLYSLAPVGCPKYSPRPVPPQAKVHTSAIMHERVSVGWLILWFPVISSF